MKKTAFITGATSGIGKATARHLASKGWALVLNGRRKEILESIVDEIRTEFGVHVFCLAFDISARKECESVFVENSSVLSRVSVLINNAGLARGTDPMDLASLDDWDQMVDTNLKGLLYMTRLSLPFLKKNSEAHIVNVGSVAGHWVYPGGGVYCSTKSAVTAISEGLRMDLHGSGIRVTNISPGIVETDFSLVRLRNQKKADAVYQGFKPLSAQDIAESIEWALSRPSHVNIQDIVIFPTDQASVTLVNRK